MYAIGHVSDWYFAFGPAGIQLLKNAPADLTMQPADTIHHAASSRRQISHVEGFMVILPVAAAQCHQFFGRYTQTSGIYQTIFRQQITREGVETGCHRG